MGSAAFKASKAKDGTGAAGSISSSDPAGAQRSGHLKSGASLDYVMGEDREAVKHGDSDAVSERVASRVNDLVNKMESALHFVPTRARNHRGKKAPPSRPLLERAHTVKSLVMAKSWRSRVAKAKENAAATLSIMRLLQFNLVKGRNYFDFVPPAIEEALDDDYGTFKGEYAKVVRVLAEVKEAHDKQASKDKASLSKAPAGNPRVDNSKNLHQSNLLAKTGVSEQELHDVKSMEEARKLAKASIAHKSALEVDTRDGVDILNERVRGSLTLMETYLSRANAAEGLDRPPEEGEGTGAGAAGRAAAAAAARQHQPKRGHVFQPPKVMSHDTWKNNPGNKTDVLRLMSEAKSDTKFGKVAVLIYAADLGPQRADGTRQPLYSMDPYDLLAEVHTEQRYKEQLEHAALLEKAKREAEANGVVDNSTELSFPVQPPILTSPITTHVEGMSLGSRMMSQLVSEISEQCGPKAVEALQVVMVTSDATESMIAKDMRANNFYGLKPTNVIFINQPSLPGFRYMPDINLFRECSTAMAARYGTGYIIEQLTHAGEAFVLGTDAKQASKAHIVESALDHLQIMGVEWIYQTRVRLIPTSTFDLGFVAHCLALKERLQANFVFEGIETTLHTARKWGNIATARTAVVEGKHDPGAGNFAQIFGNEALSTPEGQQAMIDLFQASGAGESGGTQTLHSSSGRWMMELASLQDAMESVRFTPTFCLEYELEDESRLQRIKGPPALYPQVYAHDLTLVEAIRPICISVGAEKAPKDLGHLKVDDPVGLIRYISKVQDAGAGFQAQVKKNASFAKSRNAKGPSLIITSSGTAKRHIVMVAIAENECCRAALELVNSLVLPYVDSIHLVHVCKNAESQPRALKMLSAFDVEVAVQLTRHCLILPGGSKSVPDVLLEHAQLLGATILVVASEKLDRSGQDPMGSVALALARKMLPCSLLVVKSFSTAAKRAREGLSYLIGVDAAAIEMFDWVCDLGRRGHDKMYLANCSGASSTAGLVRQSNNSVNMMQLYKDKAVGRGFMPVGRLLDGKASVELAKMSKSVNADIVVVSSSKKSGEVSKGATAIIKDPQVSAVLLYRSPDGLVNHANGVL